MTKKFETKDFILEYEETPELKEQVFQKLIQWYIEHRAFSGESIMQSDNSLIYAPVVLSDIADDIIKFKTTYKE